MKKNPGGSPASVHPRRPSRTSTRLGLALCAGLAFSSSAGAALARAPSSSGSSAPDVDPLDLFLDTSAGERIFLDPPAGSLAVSLEATYHTSSMGGSSFGAMASLQVPLERLLTPRKRALVSPVVPGAPPSLAEAPASRPRARGAPEPSAAPDERAPREPPSPPDPAKKPPASEQPAGSAPPPILVSGDLARGAVRAAVRAAKLDEADARLDALSSRARMSALLPELRLRATRAIDESESLAPTEYDPMRRTATGGTTTWLEARATFRLDRLVFADDEIALEKLRADRAAERARVVTKVLELLDGWQRARAAESDPDAKSDARSRATLAAAAAEVSLDVLTNGWFSKAITAANSPNTSVDASASTSTSRGARCVEKAPAAPAAPASAGRDAPHPCAFSSGETGER